MGLFEDDRSMILKFLKFFSGVAALSWVMMMVSVSTAQKLDDVPSFRCGGETVSVGDRQNAVKKACGQPDKIRVSGGGAVEEWIYNFGPTRFIYYVTFKYGRLERIQAGEYGFLVD